MMCESTRGEWGGICPDCGQRLPTRQRPLESWLARRSRVNEESSLNASARVAAGLTPTITISPREPRPPRDHYSFVA